MSLLPSLPMNDQDTLIEQSTNLLKQSQAVWSTPQSLATNRNFPRCVYIVFSSSGWTLPLHKAPWYWIYCFTLFAWLFNIVRSYFSHKDLSSIDIPTSITRGFEVLKFAITINIKNQLLYNFSLFTTLCPSKIWHLKKLVTSLFFA